MPFIYTVDSKSQAENYTTSATPNTEINCAFVKPGATRFVALISLMIQGKAAALTALSGIITRIKQFPTTASSGGSAVTPAPVDSRAPAAAASAGIGTSGGTAAVTSGTGTAALVGKAGCSASGPGGWNNMNNPDASIGHDGGANKSIDLFSASPTASLSFEFGMGLQE